MSEQTPNISTTTPPQVTQNSKTHPIKSFFRKVLLYFMLFAILVGVGAYFYFNSASEKGYSAGLLVNFTQKGFIFKTYEGTLNAGTVSATGGSSTSNNTWTFSVKDDSIANVLNDIMKSSNKNISLHYEEKRGNFFWQGETNRFVDGVEEVK